MLSLCKLCLSLLQSLTCVQFSSLRVYSVGGFEGFCDEDWEIQLMSSPIHSYC